MSILNVLTDPGSVSALQATAALIPIVGTCASITAVQMRARQRRRTADERMAGCLLAALHSGHLDFHRDLPEVRCNVFSLYPDDLEETQLEVMPSRYRMLGYPRLLHAAAPRELAAPSTIKRVRLLGPATSHPDENLLLGVPKALLNPALTDYREPGIIPRASTRHLASRRDMRCDSRWLRKPVHEEAHFQAAPAMAGLKVAAASNLSGPALQPCSNTSAACAGALPVGAIAPASGSAGGPANAELQVEPFVFTPSNRLPHSRLDSYTAPRLRLVAGCGTAALRRQA